ncbi:MAG: hypothetical protein HOP33_20545 [Verrucomicrobia bacterium]|nr:hypothetical protein [Verrucomicrobiota bacterium]
MPQIDLSGNIGSLLNFYKHERNIFGRCPSCREPFRISEVKLTYGKEPPQDLLTRLKTDRDKLLDRLEELESEIQDTEDQHNHELETLGDKWKDRVENEVDKRLGKKVKEIRLRAISQSRAGQLGKTLEKIAPMFPGFGHHPSDVRPIFDPIDFVIFDGHYQGEVSDIVFVEFKTSKSGLSDVQRSIRAAVKNKRVHFEEKRLGKKTLEMLTRGKMPKDARLIEENVD